MKKNFTFLFSLLLLFGAVNATATEYPFKVTTDAENPELYAIKSGRGDAYWWTYDATDGMIFLSAYAYEPSQYWYFKEVTVGDSATFLQLYPYTGEGKAMSYQNTDNAPAKIYAVTPGEEGWNSNWLLETTNGGAPYGLWTSGKENRLSNNGGTHNKMGMWNASPSADAGTAMYFEPVSKHAPTLAKAAKLIDMYNMQTAYGLVKDAAQFSSNAVEPKEGALANLIDNNYSTFFHSSWSVTVEGTHHLQMEVSEPVQSFAFYFKKRHNNNNNRPTDITIYGSNDGETFTEITNISEGFPTGAEPIDYMSDIVTASEPYKHFRFAVNATNNNTVFFTFSEFYLFPASQAVLNALELMEVAKAVLAADEESAFYEDLLAAFDALAVANEAGEDIEAPKAAVEAVFAKIAQEELDNAMAAVVAKAEAALAVAEHAEEPALGQYASADVTAFEAVVAEAKAIEVPAQEDIDALTAAVKTFYLAKNMPVFTINGVYNYALGKSIYENNDGALKFQATDVADASMLWAFDMETAVVGVIDSVVVRNLSTGNLFWSAPSINVGETSDAVEDEDDGIFLFYTEGNATPVHAQESGSNVVRWNATTANSASAWTFTYVGTTHDLYDLSATAWADVTADYVKNADLASVEGWTSEGGGYAHIGGERVAEFYAGWDALVNTSGSLKQEVTLPAGTYRLTGKAFYRAGFAFDSNRETSLGYMVAGDNKVQVKTLGSEEVTDAYANNTGQASAAFYTAGLYDNILEFTLADTTTLSLGYECTHEQGYSWFIVGEMKLEVASDVPGALATQFEEQAGAFCSLSSTAMYSLGGVMNRWTAMTETVLALYEDITSGEKVLDAKVVKTMDEMAAFTAEVAEIDELFVEFNDVKFNCFDIQDNSTAEADVMAAFEEAVSGTYNTTGIATLADLENLISELVAARQAYVLNAVPNAGYTFDYTFLIEGVGNSIEGWKKDIEGFVGNFVYKHSNEMDTDELKKTGFIEAWNPNAYKGTISYAVNDIPNGYYKISAYTFNDTEASFFANDKKVAIANTRKYENSVLDSVYVYNGKLEFGLDVVNAWWVGITNIELAFIAPKPVVEVASVTLDQAAVALTIVDDSIPSVQLVATVAPYDADEQTVTWTSSDEAVATVDVNGVVTAVGAGEATITATAGGVSATCVVTVTVENGIANVEIQENTVIYDLTGRRVEKMQKGIYIVNGKKVYVK